MKKRFIKACGIIIIVSMSVIWRIPLTKAVGHSVTIFSPTDGACLQR